MPLAARQRATTELDAPAPDLGATRLTVGRRGRLRPVEVERDLTGADPEEDRLRWHVADADLPMDHAWRDVDHVARPAHEDPRRPARTPSRAPAST